MFLKFSLKYVKVELWRAYEYSSSGIFASILAKATTKSTLRNPRNEKKEESNTFSKISSRTREPTSKFVCKKKKRFKKVTREGIKSLN
ncbi:hypothetical protein [Candidatus Rhabdochlamydia oedothoracis]|uniref:hypothetical protein n=1 Tax=Candidatus Rhabdochlamydia oedothoracis TaxID=2720720 RepID=UPI001C64E41C|nr:hypothetical protein [Candidatus Rhabdochlamydia oedothoracis]